MANIYSVYTTREALAFVTVAEVIGAGSTTCVTRAVSGIDGTGRYGRSLRRPSVICIEV